MFPVLLTGATVTNPEIENPWQADGPRSKHHTSNDLAPNTFHLDLFDHWQGLDEGYLVSRV
jgi:hypothetical protein